MATAAKKRSAARRIAAKKSPAKRAKSSSILFLIEEPAAPYYAGSPVEPETLPGQTALPFPDPADLPRVEARPFLKWAGGKAGLLSQLDEFFPHEIDRYIEPFLGGGAVFFHLKHRFPRMRAFLRDSNKELINCYRVVRDRPLELMRFLDRHTEAFRNKGDDYYYHVRSQHGLADDLARAARTIFLNKTCFNGLWRVNARGEFNTPVGSQKNPISPNRYELEEYEEQAQRVATRREAVAYFVDQAKHERANTSHETLVRLMAERLRQHGAMPKANRYIDLSARLDGTNYLFEMKSTTEDNPHSQVRRGLSQLYEYRYVQKIENPCLVLVMENPLPRRFQWLADYLVQDRDILLVWNGNGQFSCPEAIADRLPFLS